MVLRECTGGPMTCLEDSVRVGSIRREDEREES